MKNTWKIIIVLFLLISLGLFLRGKVSGQEFNSEKWKHSNLNSEKNWDLRWSMMNNLRNNYELRGKTKSEIISLLGKPDFENRNEISYSLGYTGFGINTGVLEIFFNEKGLVKKFNVHQG